MGKYAEDVKTASRDELRALFGEERVLTRPLPAVRKFLGGSQEVMIEESRRNYCTYLARSNSSSEPVGVLTKSEVISLITTRQATVSKAVYVITEATRRSLQEQPKKPKFFGPERKEGNGNSSASSGSSVGAGEGVLPIKGPTASKMRRVDIIVVKGRKHRPPSSADRRLPSSPQDQPAPLVGGVGESREAPPPENAQTGLPDPGHETKSGDQPENQVHPEVHQLSTPS